MRKKKKIEPRTPVPMPPAKPPPQDARRRPCRLGTGCMVRPQSSMSRHIAQFCGVLGHTFMEFLKGSGDYCQAQHDLYADKWTAEIHYCSTKKHPKDWLTWTQKCWIEIHRAFLYKSSDLDGVNLSALPFYCLSITGLKNCCFLFWGSLHFPLLPTSYSKGLRISSGVYWSRLSIFASLLYSIF